MEVKQGYKEHKVLDGGASLKKIDCQIFLQQRWIYLGSAENCNSGSATMVSVCKFPHDEENAFIQGKRELGGL